MNIAAFVIALITAIISLLHGCFGVVGGAVVDSLGDSDGVGMSGAGVLIFISGIVGITGGVLAKNRKPAGWKTIVAAVILCVLTGTVGLLWAVMYFVAAAFGYLSINKVAGVMSAAGDLANKAKDKARDIASSKAVSNAMSAAGDLANKAKDKARDIASSKNPPADRIRDLQSLRDSGAITLEEFESKKKEILTEL